GLQDSSRIADRRLKIPLRTVMKTYLGNLFGRQRRKATKRPLNLKASLGLEQLEDRLLPSTIIWVNRGNNDGFTPAERTVVDHAIGSWAHIIQDFDNDPTNADHVFSATIFGGSTSGVNLDGPLGIAD